MHHHTQSVLTWDGCFRDFKLTWQRRTTWKNQMKVVKTFHLWRIVTACEQKVWTWKKIKFKWCSWSLGGHQNICQEKSFLGNDTRGLFGSALGGRTVKLSNCSHQRWAVQNETHPMNESWRMLRGVLKRIQIQFVDMPHSYATVSLLRCTTRFILPILLLKNQVQVQSCLL